MAATANSLLSLLGRSIESQPRSELQVFFAYDGPNPARLSLGHAVNLG